MRNLKSYKNHTYLLKKIVKEFPVLTYRPEDDHKYELIYFGNLWKCEHQNYLRMWFDTCEGFCYKATINNKQICKVINCNGKTIEQIIFMFKRDIKKIKKTQLQQKLNDIEKDFD
jgi:hypothetical protein